jgi:hypothetical protein
MLDGFAGPQPGSAQALTGLRAWRCRGGTVGKAGRRVAVDDLPLPVVNFLNVIGVPWPYIDEDVLVEFASLTRQFAQAVEATHDDATRAVAGLAEAHQSVSTVAMSSGWARMSDEHVRELVDGCQALAAALDVAAGYIVAQKAEAVMVLIGMTEAFIADQAAAVATAGIAEAAVPLLILGAQRLVKSLVMDLQQHVVGEVIEAAAKPLLAKVEAAMSGLDWSGAGSEVSPPAGSAIAVYPDEVAAQLAVLRSHAVTMRSHGAQFAQAVAGLDL